MSGTREVWTIKGTFLIPREVLCFLAGHGEKWRDMAGHGRTAANAGIARIAGDSRVLQGSQKPIVYMESGSSRKWWYTISKKIL